MKPVRGSAKKAPQLAPAPEKLMRLDLSRGGAQRAHIAIIAGNVTP